MTRAYVKWFNQVEYDPVEQKDRLSFEVTFTGAEVAGNYDIAYGELLFDVGDPVAQMRSKVTNTILLEAAARGYVVAKQDMCIPSVQQGV